MATDQQHSSLEELYMTSILGQRNPFDISAAGETSLLQQQQENRNVVLLQLLKVDFAFNVGQPTTQAKDLWSNVEIDNQEGKHLALFHKGLGELLDGNLSDAYQSFVEASRACADDGLLSVFFGERAVNIAFWMACSGKMLEAARDLDTQNLPFAGGVVSFALHMNGQVEAAEKLARESLAKGFQDPWTVHAVAHCLYARGQSLECAQFLDQYRPIIQRSAPSAFMKGHIEFHQALAYIDMEDEAKLTQLIIGPLWGELSEEERHDYWNASGLLNAIWKAELRGLSGLSKTASKAIHEAMDILVPTATVSKSCVFSLCILRWSSGSFRHRWMNKILHESDNHVFHDLSRVVDAVYPSLSSENDCKATSPPGFSDEACSIAMVKERLADNVDALYKLGASPEQREVVEEFIAIVAWMAGNKSTPITTLDMVSWTKRNYRPNVPFYGRLLGNDSP